MDTIEQVAGCHLIRGIAFYLLCISILIHVHPIILCLFAFPQSHRAGGKVWMWRKIYVLINLRASVGDCVMTVEKIIIDLNQSNHCLCGLLREKFILQSFGNVSNLKKSPTHIFLGRNSYLTTKMKLNSWANCLESLNIKWAVNVYVEQNISFHHVYFVTAIHLYC